MTTAQVPTIYRRLATAIGPEYWQGAVARQETAIRSNHFLGAYLRSEYAIAYQLEKLRVLVAAHGSVPLQACNDRSIFPALGFAAQVLGVLNQCTNKQARTFIRRVRTAFSSAENMHGLRLELQAATNFTRRGKHVSWHRASNCGTFDLLVDDLGTSGLEIECKSISDNKGRRIHRMDALNFWGEVWKDISTVAQHLHTGMAVVFAELGQEVHISGGAFSDAVDEGVRRGYTDGYLRKSIVADPLRRGNTGDNTPAAITVHLVDGEGCRITVAPKGFGSENMSRIQMLKPADGVEGFKKFVVDTVKLAGSNPCPPIVLGIGVGGSFDKVAYLAKKALLRPLDVPNPDPYYAQLEQELLAAINELGIGPQGFGGRTTCLGLAIEQMPTHVAGLPAAVNVSCHVTRRASAEL